MPVIDCTCLTCVSLGRQLVNQLLWDNKLRVSVYNGIVNANVSIIALVVNRGTDLFENTYNKTLHITVTQKMFDE